MASICSSGPATARKLPDEARDPKVIANLRRFVERGGGLFLVSFAQSYVVDLQLESVSPDRMDFFRYGYNDASRFGGYFTIGIKGDAAHPLFQGMTPSETDPSAFFLSGSTHIKLENCFWSRNQPEQGQVLGNYFRKNEKGQILDQKQVPVLNLWTLGQAKCSVTATTSSSRISGSTTIETTWQPSSTTSHRF